MAPSYRERLRVEGATLAGFGLAGSAGLLALVPQSRRSPSSTIGQLAIVAGLLAGLGPRTTRKALDGAEPVARDEVGTGEPTPLWHVAGLGSLLTLAVSKPVVRPPGPLGERAGWDAGLRVTGGCALVGLYQALAVSRDVAAAEELDGRTYYRLPGSRIGRGTRLGYTGD